MDQKADVRYVEEKYGSLIDRSVKSTDLTMKSYLEYYRKHGVKKPVDTYVYFNSRGPFTSYSPQFGSSNADLEEIL